MPRRAEPRVLVPAGSVGIGGSQTVFIRWRRRAAGSYWGARRWHYSIENVKSRCCRVPAIACCFVPQKEGVCRNLIRAGMYTSVQDGGRKASASGD